VSALKTTSQQTSQSLEVASNRAPA